MRFFSPNFKWGNPICGISTGIYDCEVRERFKGNYLLVCGGLLWLIYFHYCHYYFGVRDNYRDWQIANAILLGKFVTFCRIIYTPLHECLFTYLFIYVCFVCKCIGIFIFHFLASLALEFISDGIIHHHTSHDRHTPTRPSSQCIVDDKSHLQKWHLKTCVPYGLLSHSFLVSSFFRHRFKTELKNPNMMFLFLSIIRCDEDFLGHCGGCCCSLYFNAYWCWSRPTTNHQHTPILMLEREYLSMIVCTLYGKENDFLLVLFCFDILCCVRSTRVSSVKIRLNFA